MCFVVLLHEARRLLQCRKSLLVSCRTCTVSSSGRCKMHLPRKLPLLGTTGRHAFDLMYNFKKRRDAYGCRTGRWAVLTRTRGLTTSSRWVRGPRRESRDYSACSQVELDPDGVVSYWKKDKEAGFSKRLAVASVQEGRTMSIDSGKVPDMGGSLTRDEDTAARFRGTCNRGCLRLPLLHHRDL